MARAAPSIASLIRLGKGCTIRSRGSGEATTTVTFEAEQCRVRDA
jgi:hypothetical protein